MPYQPKHWSRVCVETPPALVFITSCLCYQCLRLRAHCSSSLYQHNRVSLCPLCFALLRYFFVLHQLFLFTSLSFPRRCLCSLWILIRLFQSCLGPGAVVWNADLWRCPHISVSWVSAIAPQPRSLRSRRCDGMHYSSLTHVGSAKASFGLTSQFL